MKVLGLGHPVRDMRHFAALLVFALALLLPVPGLAGCAKSPSAGVPPKIIIYTDIQCGACGRLNSEVEPEIKARYVDTGKAQMEIRLVADMGDDSLRAAQAALCAGDQGRFMDYQDALFRAYRDSGEDLEALTTDNLVALATSLGLDAAALRSCLESGIKGSQVEENMRLLQADDVQTLPAVLVGNAKVEGYKRLSVYLDAVDQALKDS